MCPVLKHLKMPKAKPITSHSNIRIIKEIFEYFLIYFSSRKCSDCLFIVSSYLWDNFFNANIFF